MLAYLKEFGLEETRARIENDEKRRAQQSNVLNYTREKRKRDQKKRSKKQEMAAIRIQSNTRGRIARSRNRSKGRNSARAGKSRYNDLKRRFKDLGIQ